MKGRAREVYRRVQDNPVTVALLALGIGVAASLGAVGAIYQNEGTRAIIVQRSPCADRPHGRECQAIQRAVIRARSLSDTCILFRRADSDGQLLRITRCPQDSAGGGDASQPPSTGGQQPTPPRGGGRGTPDGTPGGKKPPKKSPPNPTPQTPPAATPPSSPTPGNGPPPGVDAPGLDRAPGLLGPVLGTVDQVRSGVCSTADRLLSLC